MDECDICGREGVYVQKYRIEGAEVLACGSCGKHGTLIDEPRAPVSRKKDFNYRPMKKQSTPRPRGNNPSYRKKRDKTLTEGYGAIITNARTSFGLTREELAKNLFIRETFLTKIESEKVRPSDDLAKKIEKTLNIELLVEATDDLNTTTGNVAKPKNVTMTLGDFAKIKKKK